MNSKQIILWAKHNVQFKRYIQGDFYEINLDVDGYEIIKEALEIQAQKIFKELEEKIEQKEEQGHYMDLDDVKLIQKKWCGE